MDTASKIRKIKEYIEGYKYELCKGLGVSDTTCSIGIINRALYDSVHTDATPSCMDETIAKWIIVVQDLAPHTMRNSKEWKNLLLLAR